MTDTHDYTTRTVKVEDLDETCVIVGESGGLSAVYEKSGASAFAHGLYGVITEHGMLLLDPDSEVEVYDD